MTSQNFPPPSEPSAQQPLERLPDLVSFNQDALNGLKRAINLQSDRFSLILARCNYQRLQTALIDHLLKTEPTLEVLPLPQRLPSLLEALLIHLRLRHRGTPPPTALMVTDLDAVENLEVILKAANLARDTFQEHLSLPLVLWIDDYVLSQMSQLAQDLKNLGPPTLRFEMPPGELIAGLHREADELFIRFLKGTPDAIPSSPLIDLSGSRLGNELTYALRDLEAHDGTFDAELDASLLFAQGRQAHSRLEMDEAKSCYEESLAYWEQQLAEEKAEGKADGRGQEAEAGSSASPAPLRPLPPLSSLLSPLSSPLTPLHKKATLLLHLGFWWRSLAVLQRSTYRSSLKAARRYFEQGLACFRQTQQSELVARFIASLAEVLQKQQDWPALEAVAQESLALHQQSGDWVRQARDHGFLAEVALKRRYWKVAQAEAQRALDLLEQTERRLVENPDRPALAEGMQIAKRFQRGWYRFLLGEAQMELGQTETALALLEQARREADADADLILYLQILEELIHHYYDLGDYRRAFEVKLERRRVEYRHNFRAFIGAGALQAHPPIPGKRTPSSANVSAEIAASGRQQDVENLLLRLQEARYQIVIVHGPSGVGKSSILNAGLIPALRSITPEGRTTIPLLVQTYGNWESAIASDLAAAIPGLALLTATNSAQMETSDDAPDDHQRLLPSLRAAARNNYFIVLIFDQFEDFFFEREGTAARQPFYDFLEACLKLPWVKLVLALREDYLHYLLEIERVADISIIDGGLLSSDVRYPLGNFSEESAEAVIRRLTESAQYFLEDALIRSLVDDLAKETGDVRPIELQVVGAQLQRESITTLKQYKALGDHPKERLVQRFLAAALKDCGPPNRELAQVVLYLLTDEDKEGRLYRPLKTREDLEYELSFLEVEFAPEQLDLVLFILVGSGLVFELPEDPEDSYQLVHDYLVRYVRQEQTPELLLQLEEAKEKQQQTEEQLALVLRERNQILENQLTLAKQVIAISLILMGVSIILAIVTFVTAQ
ncbi:MAG TPA: AAA family ATPase [Trichocoleus sp.]